MLSILAQWNKRLWFKEIQIKNQWQQFNWVEKDILMRKCQLCKQVFCSEDNSTELREIKWNKRKFITRII